MNRIAILLLRSPWGPLILGLFFAYVVMRLMIVWGVQPLFVVVATVGAGVFGVLDGAAVQWAVRRGSRHRG